MEEEELNESGEEVITARYLISLLIPIIKDELVAQCRCDRGGIRIKFLNGQIFHLNVTEIN